MQIEISDEKLRQLVREALRELGTEAAPDLVRKVVRDVIRRLQQEEAPARHAHDRRLTMIEAPAQPSVEKSRDSSQGY